MKKRTGDNMENRKTLRELLTIDQELAFYKTFDSFINSFLDDNDYDFEKLSYYINRELKKYKIRVSGYKETLKTIEELIQKEKEAK